MSACTFFGHGDCPSTEKEKLRSAIASACELGADVFYVGKEGAFDRLAAAVLEEMGLNYYIVCAYMPKEYIKNSIFPEGQECVHPRFAIKKRNRWMLGKADTVIAYVERTFGGAAEFTALAEKQGKRVINIGK